MSAKKGLGRGFESLIPTDLFDDSFDPTASDDHKLTELRMIPLDDIVADPDQPRAQFDKSALDELTASIKQHGVLQPIVVTKKDDKYEIVAGERRFRASKAAGQQTIPALIRTVSGQHKLELALIENLQRHDLNALETATAYAKLRDQFNLSLEEIGHTVGGKSVSAISNTLRLLRLPKIVQKALAERKISEGQARPLIDFDEKQTEPLLAKIIAEGWSARKVEETVRSLKAPRKDGSKKAVTVPVTQAVELEKKLAAPVKIVAGKRGGGQIVITFKDEKDLERINRTLL